MAFTAAVLVAAAVFYTGWAVLGAQGLEPEHRIDSKTLFDLVKLAFGVVAGAGALVALVVAYRRQRVDEDGALREDTRLHTERFTAAVAQLGDVSAAVRLGGVHALAGLADDAPTRGLRQTCIDVLCAYLRLPHAVEADLATDNAQARHAFVALREVRHTIIRLIRDHLRLHPDHPHSWQGHDFDLTEVTFDGGDLSDVNFSGGTVDFSRATFASGEVDLSGARFSGALVKFIRTTFTGGEVHFNRASFSEGMIPFYGATFSDGVVDFSEAIFSGGLVDFSDVGFSGGLVHFSGVAFAGGLVHFTEARFSGGEVVFHKAEFSGGEVHFSTAEFSGGTVYFDGATFVRGTIPFNGALFSGGTVHFDRSEFSDATISFNTAEFSGSRVDFSNAMGIPPLGLVRPQWSSLPAGLILPAEWLPPVA
ncbi:pentapeptide repeat-containing protein [Streptomyces sp. NPDC008343]|uniref:pentapeptide repeat-containing protein n=1 Tax=Streptomyces sp. NPDC008343 TaxID=3364828 RepID=UPI0036E01C02